MHKTYLEMDCYVKKKLKFHTCLTCLDPLPWISTWSTLCLSVAFFASQAWDLANCKLHTRRFLHVQWLKQKTCQFMNFKHKIKKQHEYSKLHHISKSEQFQTISCNLPTNRKEASIHFFRYVNGEITTINEPLCKNRNSELQIQHSLFLHDGSRNYDPCTLFHCWSTNRVK